MRLFLSSQGFGDYADDLIELVGNGSMNVALISNASDDLDEEEREQVVAEKLLDLQMTGLLPKEIDLRKYFDGQGDLAAELEKYALVWARGGNTFILRRAMKSSGFDKVIKAMLESDKIVYGGNSAGAMVATPDLRGVEGGDDPSFVPYGYDAEIIWEGLELVPYYIVPHYRSEWFGQEAGTIEKLYKERGVVYKTLDDSQAIIINGEQERLLG